MTVPRAREDPRLGRFRLRRLRVACAIGRLDFVAPHSSEEVLRRTSHPELRPARTPEPPHWAEVWPASIAIARLLTRGARLDGLRVVDLGCGIGVAGVAAGVCGASVLFADRAVDALPFACFNAAWNRVTEHRATTFDWTRDEIDGPVDVLLLADLVYEYRSHSPLLRHVSRVVESGGHALWADPFRPTANDFIARLAAAWRIESLVYDVSADGRRVPIRVAWITRADRDAPPPWLRRGGVEEAR